jgi:hypothetical protein
MTTFEGTLKIMSNILGVPIIPLKRTFPVGIAMPTDATFAADTVSRSVRDTVLYYDFYSTRVGLPVFWITVRDRGIPTVLNILKGYSIYFDYVSYVKTVPLLLFKINSIPFEPSIFSGASIINYSRDNILDEKKTLPTGFLFTPKSYMLKLCITHHRSKGNFTEEDVRRMTNDVRVVMGLPIVGYREGALTTTAIPTTTDSTISRISPLERDIKLLGSVDAAGVSTRTLYNRSIFDSGIDTRIAAKAPIIRNKNTYNNLGFVSRVTPIPSLSKTSALLAMRQRSGLTSNAIPVFQAKRFK